MDDYLKFVSERLKDLSFNINMSIIESRLTFSESEKARRESSKRTRTQKGTLTITSKRASTITTTRKERSQRQ